jgi:hypothetical protein
MTQPSGPSHQIEMKEKQQIIEAEAKTNTLHGRTAFEVAADQQGRWSKETTIIGAQPAALYPRLAESNSTNQQAAAVGPEPTIDRRDCGDTFGVALGEPHEIEAIDDTLDQLLPRSSGGAGDDPTPAVRSSPSTSLRKRKI